MLISSRIKFRKGDPGWLGYTRFVELDNLTEVRTIDSMINRLVEGASVVECTIDTLPKLLSQLPTINPTQEYIQLAINTTSGSLPAIPPSGTFLGYDLVNEALMSSLTNYGPWKGELAQFTHRFTPFGLLSLEDAKAARALLPKAKAEDLRNHPDIWALYDITRLLP